MLGVTALFAPLSGAARVLRREGIAMLIGVTTLAVMLYDLHLSRIEGLILLAGMVVASVFIVRWARLDSSLPVSSLEQTEPESEGGKEPEIQPGKEIGLGLLSLVATLAGAELLVKGGTALASALGMGSAFIGMTLVAVGTSLPELATSVAGVRRNEDDLVVGNVLGSNLFNALAVAGVAATLSPGEVEMRFRVASITMVVCSALAGWFAFTGRKIVRWEGMLLLVGFLAFVLMSYTGGVHLR